MREQQHRGACLGALPTTLGAGACGQASDSTADRRCPDVAKVKPKMIYASSKDELKKRLVGIACEIQGSDQGDVEYDEVRPPLVLSLARRASDWHLLMLCLRSPMHRAA